MEVVLAWDLNDKVDWKKQRQGFAQWFHQETRLGERLESVIETGKAGQGSYSKPC